MKARVIENLCIGCGACEAIVSDEFRLNDNGVSEALKEEVKEENKDAVIEAKDACPTSAIEVLE